MSYWQQYARRTLHKLEKPFCKRLVEEQCRGKQLSSQSLLWWLIKLALHCLAILRAHNIVERSHNGILRLLKPGRWKGGNQHCLSCNNKVLNFEGSWNNIEFYSNIIKLKSTKLKRHENSTINGVSLDTFSNSVFAPRIRNNLKLKGNGIVKLAQASKK